MSVFHYILDVIILFEYYMDETNLASGSLLGFVIIEFPWFAISIMEKLQNLTLQCYTRIQIETPAQYY